MVVERSEHFGGSCQHNIFPSGGPVRCSERPGEGERVDTWGNREELILPHGFIVELPEPCAVAVAQERALRRLDALWLPPDITTARHVVKSATGLTARRLADISMRGGGRHGHVKRGEGE